MALPSNQATSLDADIVTPPTVSFGPLHVPITDPGVSTRDGCKIFRYVNAFIVDQGVRCYLRYTFRDKDSGRPLNLVTTLGIDPQAAVNPYPHPSNSTQGSRSLSFTERQATFELRIQEWTAYGPSQSASRVTVAQCDPEDLTKGTVIGTLPRDLSQQAGVYTLNWVIRDREGQPVMMRRSFLSVERSSLADDANSVRSNFGCPTVGELRTELMDSPKDNLLIQGYEFSDEQLLAAIAKPVQAWNEEPPEVGQYTTSNFPFRNAWISAAIGYLHEFAAAYYRRNQLAVSAGGVSVNDKNREREYLAESQRRLQEYMEFVRRKKAQINTASFFGAHGSSYAGLGCGLDVEEYYG